MPESKKTIHMGMIRSSTLTDPVGVETSINKTRLSLYSLLPAGLHGENGLAPESAIHRFQIYVLPVLLCGLEVYLFIQSKTWTWSDFVETSFIIAYQSK